MSIFIIKFDLINYFSNRFNKFTLSKIPFFISALKIRDNKILITNIIYRRNKKEKKRKLITSLLRYPSRIYIYVMYV